MWWGKTPEELLKLKDIIGTRTNGCKLIVNTFRLGMRRFLTISGARVWNSLPN